MKPAEYMRARRARLRALRPPALPVVDRATVGSLEQQRIALHLPGPALSRAVGKDRDWWRRVARGARLAADDAARVQAELTATLDRANTAFKETNP
jgi:hypothetical protein